VDAGEIKLTWYRCDAQLSSVTLAQAWMAGRTEGLEKFKFAQLAAAQGDRDGFFRLGFCARVADGCEQDLNKAKENFLRASQLGDVYSMS
jgi:TPR repeat protein